MRPGRVRHGMSWTLDPDKARWFADRGVHLDLGYPVVLEATVLKEDVFAYYNERKERELVVRPGRVRAVTDVTPPEMFEEWRANRQKQQAGSAMRTDETPPPAGNGKAAS